MKPLDGVCVVSLEQAVAAPFCSSRLSDAGARVIKIERHDGDFARHYDDVVHGESSYFVWLNRGKESLCLDIKDDADRQLLHRIIAQADVFIQNLAPGASARAGFCSSVLREEYPELITVDISGYGEGPYRDMKAYDLLVQCESGLASITGSRTEPGRVGVSVCDIACGMYAHAAVLEALVERSITGKGKAIKLSLFDALADWMTVPLLHQEYGGKAPERTGLSHPSIAPYGAFHCADDREVVISVQNNREWRLFCELVLEDADLVNHDMFRDNVSRCASRAELDDLIQKRFSNMSRSEAIASLQTAGIAFGAVNSVADLSTHPQLRRVLVDSPSGPVNLVCPPAHLPEVDNLRPVPALGEHSAALRNEFTLRQHSARDHIEGQHHDRD